MVKAPKLPPPPPPPPAPKAIPVKTDPSVQEASVEDARKQKKRFGRARTLYGGGQEAKTGGYGGGNVQRNNTYGG